LGEDISRSFIWGELLLLVSSIYWVIGIQGIVRKDREAFFQGVSSSPLVKRRKRRRKTINFIEGISMDRNSERDNRWHQTLRL
jgi:hypothetical protein